MKFIVYKKGQHEKAQVIEQSAQRCVDRLCGLWNNFAGLDEVDLFLFDGSRMRQWDFVPNWSQVPKGKLIEHLEHCADLHEAFYAE